MTRRPNPVPPGAAAWLHNMSTPPRSLIRCARATLPGRRFIVDWIPPRTDARHAAEGIATLEQCLEAHGMAGLAALATEFAAGRWPPAELLEKRVRRFRGNARATVAELFEAARRDAALPTGVGVFLPLGAPDGSPAGGSSTACRLHGLRALAVLARRCGPLYVPDRPIEPSLVRLSPGLLVFPRGDDDAPGTGDRRSA